MKSIWPPLVTIFFMTYLYRTGGGYGTLDPPPLGSVTDLSANKQIIMNFRKGLWLFRK